MGEQADSDDRLVENPISSVDVEVKLVRFDAHEVK